MDSNNGLVLFTVAILITVVVVTLIAGMIIGTIRSTHGGSDWSEAQDNGFIPWSDEER